jgi:hypothetical protein
MSNRECLKEVDWLFVEVVFRSPVRKVRTLSQFAIANCRNPGRKLESIKDIEQMILDASMDETGGQGVGPLDSVDFVRATKNPKELGLKDGDDIAFMLYSGYILDEMTMKEAQKIFNFADLPAYA